MSYWYIPTNMLHEIENSSMDSIETTSTEYEDSIIYDSDYEDQETDIIHRMYFQDREFHNLEKTHGKYYLGSCHPSITENEWLLNMIISPNLFFAHPYKMICNYLTEYSCPRFTVKGVEIMKLFIVESLNRYWIYYVIVKKTFWIRLIQRHWRKAYNHIKNMNQCIKSPKMQYFRQIHGKYPIGFNPRNQLHGLLACYR